MPVRQLAFVSNEFGACETCRTHENWLYLDVTYFSILIINIYILKHNRYTLSSNFGPSGRWQKGAMHLRTHPVGCGAVVGSLLDTQSPPYLQWICQDHSVCVPNPSASTSTAGDSIETRPARSEAQSLRPTVPILTSNNACEDHRRPASNWWL